MGMLRNKLILILLFVSVISYGQSPMSYLLLKNNVNYIGLLDLYPSAIYAYSFRRLSSTYFGNCVNIRRSSDNTSINIGFVNNYIDTSAIKSFCGSGIGYVTNWYDQSGNGNNASQATASYQPSIYNNGFYYANGRVLLLFNGTSQYLSGTYTTFNVYSIFSVALSAINTVGTLFYEGNTTSNNRDAILYQTYAPNTTQLQRSNASSFPTATQNMSNAINNVITGIYTTSKNLIVYVNNSAGTAVSANIAGGGNIMNIGATSETNIVHYYYNGYISETVVYNSDQTSNATAINSNINNSYNPKIY